MPLGNNHGACGVYAAFQLGQIDLTDARCSATGRGTQRWKPLLGHVEQRVPKHG